MNKSRELAPSTATPAQERSTARRRLVQPLWNALHRDVRPALPGGVLLCVSGGPDSRTLLEVCARWPARFDGAIEVASVDHGTRPASLGEAEAVVARAHALGFAAARVTARPAAGDEHALRDARYRELVRHASVRGLGALVLAHHQGDVLEQRLLGLLGEGGGVMRNAGSRAGLCVLRPFLALPRAALAQARLALDVHGVYDDPERRSARARLRARVLPHLPRVGLLEERAGAERRRALDDDEVLGPLAAALVLRAPEGSITVARGPAALLRRALRQAARALRPDVDLRASAVALDRAQALLARGARGQIHLSHDLVAVVGPGGVTLKVRALADGAVPAYAPRVPPLSTGMDDT